MEEKHLQMSESFFLTAILAIVGGFLDSYSYLMRGHVFANAQTGNIVLFGVNLQKRDFTQAFYYFVPILAFAVGVILVEIIKYFYKEEHKIHWRQRIVALEFVLITVVGFIPLGQYDVVEDCDGISIDDIRREFGDIVASYVYQESEDKSKTWVERKGHTIDFLKNRASRNAKIIALGDKLANIRALYRDYNILGEELWERFNMKDKKMQSWYYRGMIEGFADLSEFHEYEEYCQLVNEVFPEE